MEEANLIESDSVALIKGRDNSLSWLRVYLDPDNNCFVKRNGTWVPVDGLKGFQRFEKVRSNKLCNTATGKMVQV